MTDKSVVLVLFLAMKVACHQRAGRAEEVATIISNSVGPYRDLIWRGIAWPRWGLYRAKENLRISSGLQKRRYRWRDIVADTPKKHPAIPNSLVVLSVENFFRTLTSFCAVARPTKCYREGHANLLLGEPHYSCLFIFMQDVRSRLLAVIHSLGLSQCEVAERCGVSQATISRLLERHNKRTGPAARRVLQALESGALVRANYSSVSNMNNEVPTHIVNLNEACETSADALDKLRTAIDQYYQAIGHTK